MNKEPQVLDLSRKVCHACGHKLIKNIHTRKERCIHYSCLIRNIDFTIPFIDSDESKYGITN